MAVSTTQIMTTIAGFGISSWNYRWGHRKRWVLVCRPEETQGSCDARLLCNLDGCSVQGSVVLLTYVLTGKRRPRAPECMLPMLYNEYDKFGLAAPVMVSERRTSIGTTETSHY